MDNNVSKLPYSTLLCNLWFPTIPERFKSQTPCWMTRTMFTSSNMAAMTSSCKALHVFRLQVLYPVNQYHFFMKGFVRRLVLNQRHKRTRKWPSHFLPRFFSDSRIFLAFRFKAGVHVRAVLTSLNTAFLPIPRLRFKRH